MSSKNGGVEWGEDQVQLIPGVSVLVGENNGMYPSGNSLLVQGSSETLMVDPSVTVVQMGGAPCEVDAVVNSHSHEDHVAGNGFFADAKVHVHAADLPGVASVDGLMAIYGLEGEAKEKFSAEVQEEFFFTPRPDAVGFSDGKVFDVGGVSVEAVHLPGHTRGHSGFQISGGVFFLSDIDLTGFGPYYGDVWSDLDDFEASLGKVREFDAEFYVTFHHKGIIRGRERFLEMLDAFTAVIDRRHRAMLEYLAEPRTIGDMVEHRFVYRPHVQTTFADSVEKRTAELHVQRMLDRGEAREVEEGRYSTI